MPKARTLQNHKRSASGYTVAVVLTFGAICAKMIEILIVSMVFDLGEIRNGQQKYKERRN